MTEPQIESVRVQAFKVPTDFPESDGTIEWDSTTVVLVEATGGGKAGIGFTYASASTGALIREKLAEAIRGQPAFDIGGAVRRMTRVVRNLGQPGVSAMAVSAVDIALWDLKARLLELPLVKVLGAVGPSITTYGSGGFTSYSLAQLGDQLGGWTREGFHAVKMKIGRHPAEDVARVAAARNAIGPDAALFVDANGAFTPRQAIQKAEAFSDLDVTWFEEPVIADDFAGTRFVREHAPAQIEVAGGEYGYELGYFREMLSGQAVDVLQADATRCGGITGLLAAGALCDAFHLPLSAHTAPSVHVHPCCAIAACRNVEYFHDHVRIEQMFFDGAARAVGGQLRPDLSRPGLGLELKRSDAQRYEI